MYKFLALLLTIVIAALCLAVSWGITVGLIYLVCLLFGLTFKLSIATGIWLVILIVRSVLH